VWLARRPSLPGPQESLRADSGELAPFATSACSGSSQAGKRSRSRKPRPCWASTAPRWSRSWTRSSARESSRAGPRNKTGGATSSRSPTTAGRYSGAGREPVLRDRAGLHGDARRRWSGRTPASAADRAQRERPHLSRRPHKSYQEAAGRAPRPAVVAVGSATPRRGIEAYPAAPRTATVSGCVAASMPGQVVALSAG
jgi:hypothetical protein